MALFRCLMVGENFPGVLIGKSRPIGFCTTRFVEASSVSEAETLALDWLRGEELFNVAEELRSKDAKVFFDQIVELAADAAPPPQGGFTFFIMGT